jgi:hypothetical protein
VTGRPDLPGQAAPVGGGDGAGVVRVDPVNMVTVPVAEQAEHGKGEHEHGDNAPPEAAPGVMMAALVAAV